MTQFKHTALTTHSLTWLEVLFPYTWTEKAREDIERLAYCANMGAESQEAADSRFFDLMHKHYGLDLRAIQKAAKNARRAGDIAAAARAGLWATTIKDLTEGDFFTYKPTMEPKESQVYIRGSYDRSTKKFTISKWSDICADCQERPGDYIVFTDFTF